MIFLANGHILEITTGQAGSLDVTANFGDRVTATGEETFGSERGTITTATTTTILTAPTAGSVRKLKGLFARNKHASTAITVTVKIDVSTVETELVSTTLQAGQTLQYIEGIGFFVFEPLAQYTHSRQILAASGTYTTPAGVRSIEIECIGAGGGGGGCATAATNSAAAGGGGGGAFSSTMIQNPAATYAVTIGAAGAAGTAGNNAGGTGGDTIFGAVCTAKGGLGGAGDAVATLHIGGLGGSGGPVSTGVGDIKTDGISGGTGWALAAAQALSGPGGSTAYSAGAIEKKNATTAGGAPLATNGGGGGSGACIISGGASQAGGAGAAGLIIVRENV